MRKSLGSKRNVMDDADIATIVRNFGAFAEVDNQLLDKPAEPKSTRGRQSANPKVEAAKTFSSKIFASHEFGYRRITIERPLRESYQFSDEAIATLRFAAKPLMALMQWIYAEYASDQAWSDDSECENYGLLKGLEGLYVICSG
jgi:type I restriction enzyme M protein